MRDAFSIILAREWRTLIVRLSVGGKEAELAVDGVTGLSRALAKAGLLAGGGEPAIDASGDADTREPALDRDDLAATEPMRGLVCEKVDGSGTKFVLNIAVSLSEHSLAYGSSSTFEGR